MPFAARLIRRKLEDNQTAEQIFTDDQPQELFGEVDYDWRGSSRPDTGLCGCRFRLAFEPVERGFGRNGNWSLRAEKIQILKQMLF